MRDAYRLRVTAAAGDLAALTHLVTGHFPGDERFGLAAQMLRAATAVESNIREGCGRADRRVALLLLHRALGSAGELEFQAGLGRRFRYGVASEVAALLEEGDAMKRQLASLILSLERRL